VTFDIPWPLDSGGKIRAYHLIRQLAREHKVTLFTYYRSRNQLNYLLELKKFCTNVHAFERMKVFSFRHIATTLTHPNLTAHLSHYYHSGLKKELEKELSTGNYQILHLESFYTSHLLGNYPVKQVLGTENIEWQVYLKHARYQPFYLRPFLRFEALRTKIYEEKTWNKTDAVLAVSNFDKNEIRSKTNIPVYKISNGIDLNFFEFKPLENINPLKHVTILFVGNFLYVQNQDAALYLIKKIFPLIKKGFNKVKLILVGRNIITKLRQYESCDIKFKDNINDIRDAYNKADILIAPLRASSGTQFKLLEAMATGLPIVTTPIGAKGLEVKHKRHCMIADSASKIASRAIELTKNNKLRLLLVNNSRKLVEKKYSWDVVGNKLLRCYGRIGL
jgi:glycosyltransferase involved in cell wall biosynthesis